MVERRILPNRRNSRNVTIEWHEQEFELTISFYDFSCTEIGEVFCAPGKVPEDIKHLVQDACIIISIALQHGVSVNALTKSITRYDVEEEGARGQPYTVVGVVCDVLQEWLEKE